MLKGLGTDIIEIARIRAAYLRFGEKLMQRLLTPAEVNYCMNYHDESTHLAGRFAAKEAIAKSLGVGFGEHLSWLDIQILNDELGKPCVRLSERANAFFSHPQFLLSISHCREYAVATAIHIEGDYA